MTEKIYSKIYPFNLIHMIVRGVSEGRKNLCPEDRFLQCATLKLPKGTTFEPHRHISKPAGFIIPEESWVIMSGEAEFMTYDTDGTFLGKHILFTGDISFTFNGGGHNYRVLTNGFEALEYKVGPYIDQEHDKIFL